MSKTFCPLPWSSVSVRNDGSYRVCCHANVSDQKGLLRDEEGRALNAAKDRISAARNSQVLKQIRLQMKAGQWPDACSRCRREEEAGISSKRVYAKELLMSETESTRLLEQTAVDGSLQLEDVPLLDMDLRFGNKCNLKCRMCGPSDSSSWYDDYEKMNGRSYQAPSTLNWYENIDFWQELEKNSQAVEHIYVVGGEPLLIEQHYEFLRYLIERDLAKNVILEYNTNLTVLPDKAVELWKAFKEVHIGVSVDAWGSLNDYIRKPSRFSVIEKNLDRLDSSLDNIVVWLAATVSLLNFYDLSELMIWKVRKGYRKINVSLRKPLVTHHVLHKPEFLSLQALPLEKKEQADKMVAELYDKFCTSLESLNLSEKEKSNLAQKWLQIYQGLLKHMKAKDLSGFYDEFKDQTRQLDRLRQEKFQDVVSPVYYEFLME